MSSRNAFIFSRDNRRVWGWLTRTYVRPYFGRLGLAACFMVITACSAGALAWLAQPAVDETFTGGAQSELGRLVPFLVLAVVSINGVAIYFQSIIVAHVGQRIVATIQMDLFRHFNDADAAFRNRTHTGMLLSRLMNDTGAVNAAVSGALLGLARDLLMFICLTGVMIYRDYNLALISLFILPLLAIGISRVGSRTRVLSKEALERTGDLSSAISEALDGQRLVKIYGTEEREMQRVGDAVGRRLETQQRLARARALASPITEIVGGLAIAAAMFYGAERAATSGLTFGEYGSFLAALLLAYRPLKRLAAANVSLQGGLVAGQRLWDAFSLKPAVVDSPDAKPLRLSGGEIRFETVSFAYDENNPVLQSVNLTVPSGQVVALVGPSGAGKSTLLNLIPRLYDVTGGRVTIDGQDVREVTMASLRANISVVTQETILFDDTVRANIAYGRGNASEEEIRAAAKGAAALEFIDALPQGFDTVIGQRGVRLSGGQRQRIAIARAMLRDAPILLLDEATSSLDNEAEQQVKGALQRLMKGRTTLVVAHRLSTVIDADQIHVMEDGCVVESGSHGNLLRQGGRYARLYRTQQTESDAA